MASRTDIITACNQVSRTSRVRGGPILPPAPTAEETRRWLAWSDPDGDYDYVGDMSDADALDILVECAFSDDEEVASYVREAYRS